jgi:hypothetical protein
VVLGGGFIADVDNGGGGRRGHGLGGDPEHPLMVVAMEGRTIPVPVAATMAGLELLQPAHGRSP